MRDAGDHYEYVCIHTDDITYIGKHEDKFFDELQGAGFDLKDVTKNPTVFLGGSVSRDADGTLAWGAKRYIDRSLQNVERMTGSLPHKANVPMHPDTHSELDMSEFLDEKGCELVQSLIGMLQWTVTLGRFDIACAVMTLSKHRVFPRQGHLQHILQVFGYLRKYPDGDLRFRTGIPVHESQDLHKPLMAADLNSS